MNQINKTKQTKVKLNVSMSELRAIVLGLEMLQKQAPFPEDLNALIIRMRKGVSA